MVDIIASTQQMINEIIVFLPDLLAAIVILIIGWIVGRLLGRGIAALLDRLGVDDALARTSVGKAIVRQYGGEGTRGIVQFFDLIVRWFVYLIAILAAANVLNLSFLTGLVQQIIAFLPNVAAFVILLIVGFIVIDYFADFLRNLGAAQQIRLMSPLITALQVFLYFVLVILALQQLRIDLTIIYIFITPIAWGIGLGLGAAIAIIVGFGLRYRAPELLDQAIGQFKKE
jgi:small-conductance mechanosensitive channel